MNASIIECETEAGDKQLFEGESIVKENDFEAAKTSKTNQREIKTQKSKPKEIKKMGYLLKEGEHFKIREDGVFKYKCLLCGKIFKTEISSKTCTKIILSFLVMSIGQETKQNKEKEYIKVCDQVQGQTERGKSQIGRPVFMYNQVTGKVQNVEIEIGNSNTSNGKEIRANRPSNIKN
ncbi:unnamed protein product [Mytilus edulis]|uniref:Uncharacterized protein n=1 Tax=Mytilus edulis TaxID=6550 RepID=A0A8S3TKC9_MYTED|nr:unnamed protein product [Mytilus edulis]